VVTVIVAAFSEAAQSKLRARTGKKGVLFIRAWRRRSAKSPQPTTIQFKEREGNSISVYQIQMPVAK
jgi:hypothetical protein